MGNCKTVAIVGNGPVAPGAAEAIDACGCVIRFNRPAHEPEEAGMKTDILFFMNSGKNAQALLSDPSYLSHPTVTGCHRVILPYHPLVIARYHPKPNVFSRLKGRKADWTEEAVARFGEAGKEVAILPPCFYEECCEDLAIAEEKRRDVFPSTGFMGIRYVLTGFTMPAAAVGLYGFSWQGWKRHAWDAERAWVQAKLASDGCQKPG